MANRREFLTSIAAAASAATAPGGALLAVPMPGVASSPGASPAVTGSPAALAIDGGKPVREAPLSGGGCGIGCEYYDEAERARLTEVWESHNPFRWYGSGPQAPQQCATFEKEFAERMQRRYVLGVTSGTAALITAVAALGIGPGDEVILPAWSWYSCYDAIVLAGALPVFAECDRSLNMDPDDIEHRITPYTKAIMPADLEGCPSDMERILAIARKHGLKVLEDCAQSLGASYKGKPVGSTGDISIYSFHYCKTITSGEGGALVTDDPILFERACRFHDLGPLRPPLQQRLGGSRVAGFAGAQFRMSEFTGAVLVAQMRKLDTIVAAMRTNGRRVYAALHDLPNVHYRQVPDPEGELVQRIYLEFPTKQLCDRYIRAMKAENVLAVRPKGSDILPLDPIIENKGTAHPAWPSFTSPRGKAIRYGAEACPRTIDIINRFAAVWIDPKFTDQDTQDIATAIKKVYPAIVNS